MNLSPVVSIGRKLSVLLPTLLMAVSQLHAATYPMPENNSDLIGYVGTVHARQQETLLDIARRFDLGQNEILYANPKVDRWIPGEGTIVTLPARFLLPPGERKGIILNLPEMRLYYFHKVGPSKSPMVTTHPVSVGRMDWNTPLGRARISSKQQDPSWRPPASLKSEAAAEGESLPDVVPPGPENPLGRYAMRLSIPGYLIHSTNKPYGVGMRVTHGCIRMYPEDIEVFFQIVPINTPVQIINHPVKVGWKANTLFMEVHPQMDEDQAQNINLAHLAYEMIIDAIEGKDAILDIPTIKKALKEKSGMPLPITTFVADGFEF